MRYWAQPAGGDGPRAEGGAAEGEGDPFAAPSGEGGDDPSVSERLRQLARIKASRPVLLAGARPRRLIARLRRAHAPCTPCFCTLSPGVATLLDDGRGDGTAAGLVHALRDWAGA